MIVRNYQRRTQRGADGEDVENSNQSVYATAKFCNIPRRHYVKGISGTGILAKEGHRDGGKML